MADLTSLTVDSINTDTVSRSDGTVVLNVSGASPIYVRRHVIQSDTTDRSTTTSWSLGPTFPVLNDFQAGSKIHLFYSVPMRNDDVGWGGGYIEPQLSINGGSWQSLGSCGYDGGVMGYGARIVTYRNNILIDPQQTNPFNIQFRFYFKSHSGTIQWNDSRDIGLTSGTAPLLNTTINDNFHAHIKVKEIAKVAG